jgi:hypothetical protein
VPPLIPSTENYLQRLSDERVGDEEDFKPLHFGESVSSAQLEISDTSWLIPPQMARTLALSAISGRVVDSEDVGGIEFIGQEMAGPPQTFALRGSVRTEQGQPLSGPTSRGSRYARGCPGSAGTTSTATCSTP